MKYWILAGANQGNISQTFKEAFELLTPEHGLLLYLSPLYQSEAWGFESDSPFLNQLCILESDYPPPTLMRILLEIEEKFGRMRTENRYAERSLDLDILFAGNLVYTSSVVQIPHPRMHLRNFTLMPCVDYMPDFIHPLLLKTMAQLLRLSPDESVPVRLESA